MKNAQGPLRARGDNSNAKCKKVLIVDDEPEIRAMIKETLAIDDYCILEADSGENALAKVLSERPDLVLLDVKLPGILDGLDVCRQMKHNPHTRTIPVFFVTAIQLPPERLKLATPDEVFIKPFSPISLLDKVSEVLD